MRSSKLSLLVMPAFFVLLPVSLSAQVDTVWVHRWTSPGAESDWAYAITVDDSAHIYVTGKTNNSGTNDDWTTIKYYPNGDTAWIRNFASPGASNERANAVAIGLSGNIYLTGYTMSSGAGDYLTIKYRPNGDTAWTKIYDGISSQYDFARWVAVDDQENVYVTGYSRGLSYQFDIATVKYDSSGNQLWVARLNGSGNYNDQGNKVIVDNNGYVYVAGYVNPFGSGTRYDYVAIKYYAASGETAWVRTYNGTADSSDIARDIEVDDSGNVYVTGSCRNSGTLSDIVTIKYDSTGYQEWVAIYDNPDTSASDGGYGIEVDSLGNVYVVGQSQGLGTGTDIVTIKYDPDGNEIWTERYNGPADDYDTPSTEEGGKCMTMDLYGNIYITGVSRGATSMYDYVAIKYDSAGVEQWVAGYNCCDSVDYALAVATDNAGGVYIAGRSVGLGTYYDMATVGFWHPLETLPPLAPYIASVGKSGNDLILTWNKITTDTLGNPEIMDYYVVYRNTSPSFIPGASDSIGAVLHPDTTYTDPGVLNAAQSYYYLVKAVDWARNKSKKSNMGYKLNKFVNENAAATDKNWVSVPWHSPYDSASDLTGDVSPDGDPLNKITNLRNDQLYESWAYTTIPFPRWTGVNFEIESGRGYEIVTIKDDTLVFVGANDPHGLVSLNENPAATDKNWVSVPYNAVYNSVNDITDEYSPSGSPLTKLTNLRDDQLYESWAYTTIPFPRWTGVNFAIENGRGYEFVTTSDTTWDPTEYSNEAGPLLLARRSVHALDIEMHLGTLTEPDRAPVWSVMEGSSTIPRMKSKKNIDYMNAQMYAPINKDDEKKVTYREAGVSHLVRGYLELQGYDHLVFTAYRPNRLYDALTENTVGCGTAMNDISGLFWFDAGNFKRPWKDNEEVVLVIEASKNGKGCFNVVNVALDDGVDIQELGKLSLVPIPEPKASKGVVEWNVIDNDNVVGYSLYQNDKRLNHKIIVAKEYPAIGVEANLKPVIKGGYETVYGSQGPQSTSDMQKLIEYAISIFPNPFTKKTRIDYALPKRELVDIKVYDIVGRHVKTVVSKKLESGYYQTDWHGDDDIGRTVSAGIYFIQMNTEGFKSHLKVIFVR